jgi:hypothetical protein
VRSRDFLSRVTMSGAGAHGAGGDGAGGSAQRSSGSTVRVIACACALVLAVAAGASWEEGRAAPAQRPARQQALWEGALSRNIAKHIVRQQAVAATAAMPSAVQSRADAASARPPAAAPSAAASWPAAPRTGAPQHARSPAPHASTDTPAEELAKLAALKAEGILDEAAYSKAKAKVLAAEQPSQEAVPTPKAKLFDAFATAGSSNKKRKSDARPGARPGAQKLALSPPHPVHATAHKDTVTASAPKKPVLNVAKAKTPKRGSQEWERQQDAHFFDSLGESHTGAEKRAIHKIQERMERNKEERERFLRREASKVHGRDAKKKEEIARNEALEVKATIADRASDEGKSAAKAIDNQARTPALVEFWDKQMKAVGHSHSATNAARGEKNSPVNFWDKKMRQAAEQRLAAKAAAIREEAMQQHAVKADTKTSAPQTEKKVTRVAAGHGPKKGSPQWEREQDAKFFDSLGKNHGAQEREIRKIKDRVQRKQEEHALFEKEEEAKVHAEDVKAREEQRNAELAARQYTKSAFQDMDKHLSNINSDSVTGFKAMEAKELASEVERDHPNESSQQIAARAMKLLGLVMKGRHGDPQVSGTADNVSPMGPMGVAAQVGGV